MIRTITAATIVVALCAPAQASDLALKKVMLSSAGVGYFEYAADIDGAATLGLDVPFEQVDDVLKSLIVFDDAGGVGGIELPSRDQSHAAFGDVPFGPEALKSPLAFLNSLQGIEVTVNGPHPLAGRILQAEIFREGVPGTQMVSRDRTRVSVLTADGLKQFVLEDTDAVQVTDPELRTRIERALASMRHESSQNARHLTIRTSGTGHRTVRVGYVAVAPLWKASYRLVMPAVDADPARSVARMQGWATLENASGVDWSGVSVSLQYGNPVTFHQAIYRSYFVDRPEVPVEVLTRLLPAVDALKSVPGQGAAASSAPTVVPLVPSPAMRQRLFKQQGPGGALGGKDDGAAEPETIARPESQAEAAEGVFDTLFTITAPVTLAAGHSASVPILDRDVPAERIGIAHQGDAHPLAALRLRNNEAESLPAGVLTLYAGPGGAPYAGDARLSGLPGGESRLVSFAQDLKTDLQFDDTQTVSIASIKAANGTLTVQKRTRDTNRLTLIAPHSEPRRVLIELPKRSSATIAADLAKSTEETATAWRFAVDLKPGETRRMAIGTDTLETEAMSLTDDGEGIAAIINLQGATDEARAAIARISGLRAEEEARTGERDKLTKQRDAVEKDEERLRENLKSVTARDVLRARLIRQLDDDETRIAQLATVITAASAAADKAGQALADAISSLKL